MKQNTMKSKPEKSKSKENADKSWNYKNRNIGRTDNK